MDCYKSQYLINFKSSRRTPIWFAHQISVQPISKYFSLVQWPLWSGGWDLVSRDCGGTYWPSVGRSPGETLPLLPRKADSLSGPGWCPSCEPGDRSGAAWRGCLLDSAGWAWRSRRKTSGTWKVTEIFLSRIGNCITSTLSKRVAGGLEDSS